MTAEEQALTATCRAVAQLYSRDKALFELDASERAITHKLAEHLQAEFMDWNVDCEYNRRGLRPKVLVMPPEAVRPDESEAVTVYPDIIVHRRGTDDNFLVIEVKKERGSANTHDREKLMAFGSDPNYRYQLGLFLRLGEDGCSRAEVFFGGESVDDWTGKIQSAITKATERAEAA